MLGESIVDESGAETVPGTAARGLGLLPLVTEFAEEKTRTRITEELSGLSGVFSWLNGKTVTGYEIHMGRTYGAGSENRYIDSVGNVFGTYIHGFFDSDELREAFLQILFGKKGINREHITELRYEDFKEEQYDKLASVLRESLDMDKVYRIMGLEK